MIYTVDPLPEVRLAMDNDVFSWLRNKNVQIQSRVKEHIKNTGNFPSLPSTTIFESTVGIEQQLANGKISETQASAFLARIAYLESLHNVLPLSTDAFRVAAHVIGRLGEKPSKKHWYDVLIVATAVVHGNGIASGNRKDMELIASKLPEAYLPLGLAIWRPT